MTSDRPSDSPFWDAELIGGPEQHEIVIADHDPGWAAVFAVHRRKIEAALGDIARRVEHVGSTSVAGLAAKPIVDLQVSVPAVDEEASYVPALEEAGYVLRVREAAHRMLRTPERDVHVHVCDVGGAWERRHLLFRDWLRRSPEDCERYARTKRELAARGWPTIDHYADAKTEIIADITVRAEHWARQTCWSV